MRERLQRFYAPQARGYDRFRERLLHGRRELIARLPVQPGGRVVELGGGTGRNLDFFGARLAALASFELVDLCPALLSVAQERLRGRGNVRLVEADAGDYRPSSPADCVYFSYALTMIPDWRQAIDNAIAMLRPGGTLGVVDFHLPDTRGPAACGVPGSGTTVCGCPPSTCPTCAHGWIRSPARSAAGRCPTCRACACPITCSSAASDETGTLDLSVRHPPRHARLPGATAARFPQGIRLRAPVPGR